MFIISCNLTGTFIEQLFKLFNIYYYTIKNNKHKIVLCDNININEDLKNLIKTFTKIKIELINENEFNKIPFYYYFEKNNKNKEIPLIKNNLYLNGSFIDIHESNDINFINEKNEFIKFFLLNNNDYYNIAVNYTNNTVFYITKPLSLYEPNIIHYNNAYEKLKKEERNLIVISNDYKWAIDLLSINNNFKFLEDNNECIQLLIMILSPIIVSLKTLLLLWIPNNKKIIIII